MNATTTRWLPVLTKCKEIDKANYMAYAILFENQLGTHKDSDSENIADFTRFTLPMIRKIIGSLIESGVRVIPVEKDLLTESKFIVHREAVEPDFNKININRNTLFGIDAATELIEDLTELFVKDLKEKVIKDNFFMPVTMFMKSSNPHLFDFWSHKAEPGSYVVMEWVEVKPQCPTCAQ